MSDSPSSGFDSAASTASDSGVQSWDPHTSCKNVDSFEIRMSRGFLRSAPARWFPGLNSHWLPILHSTGIEFKVLEVAPLLTSAMIDLNELEALGAWFIDDEPLVLYADSASRTTLAQAFIPNSSRYARKTVIEYLCRRVAISLQASWSGMESSRISYDSEFAYEDFRAQAWIRVRASINNEKVVFAFGLGRLLAEKLDGLWRRQIRPGGNSALILNKQQRQGSNTVRFELARLSVAPQSLPAYLKAGSLIDLEIPLSTNLTLKLGEESWLTAALCCCDDRFALETVSLNPSALQVVEGATPLCIEFGSITVDSLTCAELEQPGAMIETGLPVSDLVQLSIRGEKVGRARLVRFEGRFALSIL